MIRRRRQFSSALLGMLFVTVTVTASANEPAPIPSLAPMLEKISGVVVNLSSTTHAPDVPAPFADDPFFRRFFDAPRRDRGSGLGSGVIVDAEKGYVITNHHLIDEADEITVTTDDGKTLTAELVGSDADSDVAVLKIPADNLSAIPLGDSAALRVGDYVVAIGNPFGLNSTVTSGIVSALGRSGLSIERYEDFIQTDAAINPGNSGGALVNLRGELVGINTAIFSRGGGSVGIGFAIPVNMVKALMSQLIEHGSVRRGFLGVRMQDLTPGLAEAFGLEDKHSGGAVVNGVIADSAAEKAGVLEGDVIVKLNDTPIKDSDDLRNAVGLLPPGARVEVQLYRDGKLKTLRAKVKSRDGDIEVGVESDTVTGESLTERLSGATFGADDDGIAVLTLTQDGAAAQYGLREDDIILSINRKSVKTLRQFSRAIKRADGVLLIKLARDERVLFLVIQ